MNTVKVGLVALVAVVGLAAAGLSRSADARPRAVPATAQAPRSAEQAEPVRAAIADDESGLGEAEPLLVGSPRVTKK
jgi:hypothetical protein